MATVSDLEKKILNSVVRNYLDFKRATRRKVLLDAFQSPGAIDRLVSTMVLDRTRQNNYLPNAIAFHYCGDPEVQALTKRGVRAVAHVFKKLIREDHPNLDPANIEALAKEFDSGTTDKMVRVGLFVAGELGLLSGSQGRNDQQVDVIPVNINEYIYEKNPENLWDDFIRRNDAHPQPTVNPTPSQTQKYGGWEIIEPLGGGGQSDVFLVRSPARVARRAVCQEEIKTALEGDQRGGLPSAIWNYARPELTEELGALKQFKIPPKSSITPGSKEAEAIERLKNEISVLEKGLPGLPKLLDFNEARRWIVTEYFPERTLEHHPFKYKGNAILALRAFRSLVQTIALLHRAQDLLGWIDEALGVITRGGQLLREGVPRPCRICGKGFYQAVSLRENPNDRTLGLRFWTIGGSGVGTVPIDPLACDYCGHVELFKR